ncbi:MAG: hypothetical protein NUV67_02015 [archaeon]|nr:hypothetical protein [archaeon]
MARLRHEVKHWGEHQWVHGPYFLDFITQQWYNPLHWFNAANRFRKVGRMYKDIYRMEEARKKGLMNGDILRVAMDGLRNPTLTDEEFRRLKPEQQRQLTPEQQVKALASSITRIERERELLRDPTTKLGPADQLDTLKKKGKYPGESLITQQEIETVSNLIYHRTLLLADINSYANKALTTGKRDLEKEKKFSEQAWEIASYLREPENAEIIHYMEEEWRAKQRYLASSENRSAELERPTYFKRGIGREGPQRG